MSIVFWILIILGISFLIFYLSKITKIKEREKKAQDETERQAKEQMTRPENKLHEEEKNRWEDEYWKRKARGER